MYYKVTFEHSENVFCTNIAIADSVEAVKDHYSKYSWSNVRECAEWEVEEGKNKGMPIITIEAKEEPEAVEEKGENTMEKTITRTIVMTEENYEHCKHIADELKSLVNGNYVNVDGDAVEVMEDDDGNYIMIDGERVDADDYDSYTLYDWFNDCLDIEYTVSSDLDYKGVRVCVAWGGPSIYIDTMQKKVLLYWWTEYAEYELASEVVDEIDAVFNEYYEMRRC